MSKYTIDGIYINNKLIEKFNISSAPGSQCTDLTDDGSILCCPDRQVTYGDTSACKGGNKPNCTLKNQAL